MVREQQVSKKPDVLSDEDIISRILKGEKKLFEALMRKYNERLYRIGMTILNNEAEVEDAMQTAYMNAYESLAKFKNRSSFGTWLVRILINESLLQLKKKKHHISIERPQSDLTNILNKLPAAEMSPGVVIDKELITVLENLLSQLPEKYRLVFMMREIENMKVAETAKALSISETNVKVRLNRARVMLRKNLNDYYSNIYRLRRDRCDAVVKKVFTRLGI